LAYLSQKCLQIALILAKNQANKKPLE